MLYAKESLFPEEIYKYYIPSNLIDIYKLSCRPISYIELDNLLKSYIEGSSKKYIDLSVGNYHLYGRLGHFSDYYSEFDYEKIVNIKKDIWNGNL